MDQNQKKYAKSDEFAQPKLIIHSALQRVKAETVGAPFADKAGMINREVFVDPETENERTIDSTSYGFYKAIKEATLAPGDSFILLSIVLPDPFEDGKNYRHWIAQKTTQHSTTAVQVATPEAVDEPAADDVDF